MPTQAEIEDIQDMKAYRRVLQSIPDQADRALTVLAMAYGTACAAAGVSDADAYEALRLSLLNARRNRSDG